VALPFAAVAAIATSSKQREKENEVVCSRER
jgi:hypothetical protein